MIRATRLDGQSATLSAAALRQWFEHCDSDEEADMTVRDGNAEWHGDVRTGSGEITVGDGVFQGPYSFASRFEDAAGTNPEQLIAAALAGCFTMALSNLLTEAGHPPESVRTHSLVHLRNRDGEISLSRIDLNTAGHVAGLSEAEFQRHAAEAKANCPISRALAGVPEITLSTKLE
jgi:lipoyl-dependent peroxiredoxin